MKKVVRMPLRRAPQRPRPQAAQPMRARTATVDEAYDDEEEDYGGETEPNMNFMHAVVVVLVLHIIAVGGIFAFNSIKAKQTADAKNGKAPISATPNTAAAENEPEVAPADVPAQAATAPVKQQNLDSWIGRSHTVQAGETLSRIAAQYKVSVSAIEKANEITSYSTLVVGQVLKIPPTGAPETKQTAPASTAAKHETAPAKAPAPTGTIGSAPRPATTATAATASATSTAETSKPAPAVTKTEAATDTPGAHGTASGDVYTVAKGDNPYSIAKKLHVSYSELLSVNEIKDPTKIQIGQKLKIPATKKN